MTKQRGIRAAKNVEQRARELRQPLTKAEAILWKLLRGRKLAGYKFRRQHPIGQFIADFYCAEAMLIVELDGAIHDEQIEYDDARTEWLAAQGYQVIRFQNSQVINNLGDVARTILSHCHELTGKTQSSK